MALKCYLYISDAKVDMLLPQISDGRKGKIATEFGLDLTILHAKRTTEYAANDERIARLETVVSFIRSFGNLGTINKPDQYIEDSAPMCSAQIGPPDAGIAYYTGTVDNTTIALGGSTHHVIGAGLKNHDELFGSATPGILSALKNELADAEDISDDSKRMGISGVRFVASMLNDGYCPTENLRFMAKRLLWKPKGKQPWEDEQLILATPLYVTKED